MVSLRDTLFHAWGENYYGAVGPPFASTGLETAGRAEPHNILGQETRGQTGRFLAKVTEKVPSAPAHHDRMYLPHVARNAHGKAN